MMREELRTTVNVLQQRKPAILKLKPPLGNFSVHDQTLTKTTARNERIGDIGLPSWAEPYLVVRSTPRRDS
jgi:hypothetical protein